MDIFPVAEMAGENGNGKISSLYLLMLMMSLLKILLLLLLCLLVQLLCPLLLLLQLMLLLCQSWIRALHDAAQEVIVVGPELLLMLLLLLLRLWSWWCRRNRTMLMNWIMVAVWKMSTLNDGWGVTLLTSSIGVTLLTSRIGVTLLTSSIGVKNFKLSKDLISLQKFLMLIFTHFQIRKGFDCRSLFNPQRVENICQEGVSFN